VVLRVGVLGSVAAWYDDRELPVGQPRQQAVLGILAMRANRVISRGELVDAVWGHDPPASAEGGIYTYVAGLRRIIEPNRSLRGPGRVLVSSGAGYVLHLVPGQPDAVAFEQDVGRARQQRKTGDAAAAVTTLDAALSLWRGIAFAGVPGPFAATERVRLGELRSAAAEERADALLSLGRHEEVVPDLTAMVADHPLRERMRGLLMIALYRCGRHAEALRVYQDGRRVLAEELGIDPGGDLSRIHQQVLTMDPALTAPDSPALVTLVGDAAETGSPLDEGHRRPRPEATPTPVPAQLPLDAPGFAGRREELSMLHAMLPARPAGGGTGNGTRTEAGAANGSAKGTQAGAANGTETGASDATGAAIGVGIADRDGPDDAEPDQTVPIVVISGTAGTGKTALAIRFGRQVARCFPDGQLYVNLRGLDPATPPMEPAEALRFFLDGLGVPPHRIPADIEGRSALFRSLLDGKRMLIVLDNARNVAQVRPLLPGSPGSLVVVTSRNEMTGLVAAEGAVPLTVDVLGDAEAHEMLARRLGRDRVAAEPGAADEIIEACARLPLALGIAAGRAASRPKRPLTELAAELHDARGRLDALEADDAVTDVRAVLSWSYDQLSEPAAHMFRLLGVHPGPDVSLSAAASLAGMPRSEAGAALRELTRTHMVAEYLPARFTFHDLLRAYAADQAERRDPEPERQAAVHRVLDHYLHTAMAASNRFSPNRSPLALAGPQPGVLPADVVDKEQAMAWFDAEVPVLLALIAYADANGFDTHAWQISWTLGPFFNRRGRWHDYTATQHTALAAARRLGDTLALAHAHHLLGHVQSQVGAYDEADPNFRKALDLFRELGDRPNEAVVLNGLAGMLEKQERYPEALAVALDALRMLKAAGHWWTQATLENGVGWLYAHLGQYDRALTHCQRALSLHRDSGHRGGTADTLDSLGYVYLHLGDIVQAKAHYTRAIEAYREIGSPFGEGNSLAGLGDALLAEGDPEAAAMAWRQSVDILDRLPHPLADEVRARLRGLQTNRANKGRRQKHPGTTPSGPDGPGQMTGAATTVR
jgi:DNA-binding SARP family transcriptional activator/tetratricopeptide (TPR) repeat protein